MTTSVQPARTATPPGTIALSALAAAVAAGVAAAAVALLATALGAPDDAMQLQPSAYLLFAVVGAVVGAIGWAVVLRRSAAPRRLLTRLVVVVMAVLFVPDVLIGVSGNATWGTVAALVVMHVAVAAAVIAVYQRLMPARH